MNNVLKILVVDVIEIGALWEEKAQKTVDVFVLMAATGFGAQAMALMPAISWCKALSQLLGAV